MENLPKHKSNNRIIQPKIAYVIKESIQLLPEIDLDDVQYVTLIQPNFTVFYCEINNIWISTDPMFYPDNDVTDEYVYIAKPNKSWERYVIKRNFATKIRLHDKYRCDLFNTWTRQSKHRL